MSMGLMSCGFFLLGKERIGLLVVDNYKKVRQVLFTILLVNIAVAVTKLAVGTIIKSASLTADGFHSLSDGASNIIGLIGVKLASKPVDEDHPYGHGKFETLAGLFIGAMLFLIGAKIVVDAVGRFLNPVEPNITVESLLILLITLVINILISSYEYRQGKKLNSSILISDSMHTRSDIYVTLGVLVTLIFIRLGFSPIIDPITSLVVAALILHAAYEVIKDNSDVLVDKAVVDREKIRDIILSFEQVRNAHKIRSRGTLNDLHIDLHLMLDPHISVEESHELMHKIEDKLAQELGANVQMIAHLEPYNQKNVEYLVQYWKEKRSREL